ncbi:hypothetical protein Bca52824_060555 [Brassica carinata]|uniref:Uncharacterized protein n=1 Tax=Brassica carinata TaxID=52824 RepID=A0A8X7QWP1_BRACI|nr:hypothetical protein Bca52824_060555 [Brassica carinata]
MVVVNLSLSSPLIHYTFIPNSLYLWLELHLGSCTCLKSLKPAWLDALYAEKFFVGCPYHETAKKNEKNVRRYVYHEVIRLEDLQKLIDCSNVQAYTINSAKVVFIKKRPQNRQFKGAGNYCTSCDRSLQEPFIHCSLGCKVEFVMKRYRDITPFIKPCHTLTLGPDYIIPQDLHADDNMAAYETPRSTVVDGDDSMSWSSTSSELGDAATTTHVVRKKRTEYKGEGDDIGSSALHVRH